LKEATPHGEFFPAKTAQNLAPIQANKGNLNYLFFSQSFLLLTEAGRDVH